MTTQQPWDSESPGPLSFTRFGLQCYMQRNGMGAWCGYVGVSKDHPLFEKTYGCTVVAPASIVQRSIDIDKVGVLNLVGYTSNESDLKDGRIALCLAIDVHGGLTYSQHGTPDKNFMDQWFLGFDCAHSGDLCPKFYKDPTYRGLALTEVYRTEQYVIDEVTSLAKQVSEWRSV